ncbi:MAG: RagB/SusD family nutrient uptake outer membrane protein [Bacteroidaceae bacterium]|nr:RagB/SusD family nutrient uptake outer membrane protein [Bacteroidaceae bacterium]MBQ8889233.1 RagB/SusD family nutrient uptake outer membrane protein [Bacteroidaceae bacterium]
MKKHLILAFSAMVLSASFVSCDDFLETSSSTDVTDNIALSNTNNLDKILLGPYHYLFMGGNVNSSDRVLCGLTGMLSYYDMAGVDIMSHSGMGGSEYTGYTFADTRTQASDGSTKAIWTQFYDHINRCNIILDALETASGPDSDKQIISGQAKAIRAISYFQLILNYQQTYAIAKDKRGVILRLSANDPDAMPFSTVEQVYTQILKDLKEAATELQSYEPGNAWRITTEVVNAWLARVYQVMGNWTEAFNCAKAVYSNHSTLLTKEQWCSGFDDFIQNGYNELVWGYQNTDDTNVSYNAPHNMWFNGDPSVGEGTTGYIYTFKTLFVSNQWLALFGDDDTDYRASRLETTPEDVEADPSKQVTDEQVKQVMLWHRTTNAEPELSHKWTYNKFKHYGIDGKTRPDICLIRSSEMLLIMAEAKANMSGGESEALGYLTTLQNARNVKNPTTTTAKADLLEAIYVERRKELLGEGVTGMYDLNRLQKDATREVSTQENNFSGHFSAGLVHWGTKAADGKTSTLKSNDYQFFCQIPEDEFAKNDQISQSEQNPMKGQ